MTGDESFEKLAAIIRKEIKDAENDMAAFNYAKGSSEDAMLRYEIKGMRRILAYVDPEPWK